MATVLVRCRTAPREPGTTSDLPTVPSGPTAARWTVPTGFAGVPPPGPAIPVTPTPEHQDLIFDTVRRSVNPDHGLDRG